MDRRSWLWRKKSSERSPGETESSVGSISSHSERFSDDQVYMNQNYQSLEVGSKSDPRQSEDNHGVKTLSEKLEEALATINAKEELVKQHAKVAEEAVSGWEKAESEVSSLRHQVEVLTVRNSTLEDRIGQLDGALKECLRQLRQTREEKDQIAHEAHEKKNSETESSSTSIDIDLLHKLEMSEKENSDLKLELSSMAEELEIRLIERDLSNQAAEQVSKQLLDSVKKVVKLEAECHRLNSVIQKGNDHESKARKTSSISGRNQIDSFVEIDLMDDFLEMERLVGMPESSEVEVSVKKVEKESENELIISRKRLEEAESKSAELEKELKDSRKRLKESESKVAESENKLKELQKRFEEAQSKSAGLEDELVVSRNRIEESESKLVETEKELKVSRKRFEEAHSKLAGHENELKASRNGYEESMFKLAACENELKALRTRLKEAESKLANEVKASRYRLKQVESKLGETEKELNASRYWLEETESKLVETESRLEMAELGLEDTYMKKEDAELRCKALEAKLEILHMNLEKERDLSGTAEAKCWELEDEVSRLQCVVQDTKSITRAEELRFRRAKQDKELAINESKFAECQKTIASLTRQLKTLATIDDFLIDTNDS